MKYMGSLLVEFAKYATDWNDLDSDAQREYLKRHPKSKRRVTSDSPESPDRPKRPVTGEKPARGDWGQRYRLRDLRLNKMREIKGMIDSEYPIVEVDSRLVEALYNKKKIDVIENDAAFKALPENVYRGIIDDIESKVNVEGIDKGELERLYEKYRDVDVGHVNGDEFKSRVVSENESNREYESLLVSLGRFVNTRSVGAGEEDKEYIRKKYSDILVGDLGDRVEELMELDVNSAGDRREGIRVPGSSKYVEDMGGDELWKVYLSAVRWRESTSTWKDYERAALKRIESEGIGLKMPFGKYEKMGWTAQDVIKKDKGYSNWLSGKISEKDSERRTPFEKWFLMEYANEYLV